MKGVICRRHVIAHPLTTIQSFGWSVFFRALTAGPDRTFLSIIAPTLHGPPVQAAVSSFIERCVALELRAGTIYQRLAKQFAAAPPLARFFEALDRQEQDHAQLLQICLSLAGTSGWGREVVQQWQDVVPHLERRMAEVEGRLAGMTDHAEVLALVIEIEGSEINSIFRGVVSAADNDFVRTFQMFQNAEAEHLDFICNEIPRLEVELTGACADLRARHH